MMQKLIQHVLYPLDCVRSGDRGILQYRKALEASQYLTGPQLEELSFSRMQSMLTYAYEQIDFYRRRFDEHGVHPGDIQEPADLVALPVLEKQDIQNHRDELISREYSVADLVLDRTGGSTGKPIEYYYTKDRSHSRKAATWRHNGFIDWQIGDKTAVLWGAARDLPKTRLKQKLRNYLIDRTLFFNTAGFQPDEIDHFNQQLKQYRPQAILAYANSLGLFARYLREQGIQAYSPRVIVTSAEMLSNETRQLIEEVFAAPVYNRYGSREFSVIASECCQRDGLHVMQEGLYMEILKQGKPAALGEVGELIITDLLNFGMPLIRYRIGDAGAWAAGECDCGRGLKRLKAVAGRTTDFLVGQDGRLCSGAVLTVAMVAQRPSLGQIQLEQNERGRIICRVAPPGGTICNEDQTFLTEQVLQYLGPGTSIEWDIVSQIDHEPSGKYRFSKSTLTDLF
ncbi:MAG: hypothetical protein MK108_03855 [Mariniblastus sp.]|nr:hypothetical protein [Mariniblastus sp.]